MAKSGKSIFNLVLLALLILGLFAVAPVEAASLAQATDKFGVIGAVALDAKGNGWAAATSTRIGEVNETLLRIENGSWRPFANSKTNPELLAEDYTIGHIVLTADGNSGWTIGKDVVLQEPLLWRLEGGKWSRVPIELPSNARGLSDIVINSDGTDGLITVHNPVHAAEYLLRLRDGQWNRVEMAENMGLFKLSLSPNGQHGWAIGYIGESARLFKLIGGNWTLLDGWTAADTTFLSDVATDDAGNGWIVASTQNTEERIQVIRLHADAAPRIALEIAAPVDLAPRDAIDLTTTDVAIDRLGRGWIGGRFSTVRTNTPSLEYNFRLVMLRLDGESITQVPATSLSPLLGDNSGVLSLATAADGGQIWVGGENEQLFGFLAPIHEPWLQQKPAAAEPMPGGNQSICFAEVPYCLRGSFATFWQQNGGLDRFGYPISTEVSESHDDKQYRVQYTQRARLEDHPENAGTLYAVLLGLLGNTLVDPRLTEDPFKPSAEQKCAGCLWAKETGHNIAPPFTAYWQQGGLSVYGLPRSEAFSEKNAADGKTYGVQYFERNRIEYHPENRGSKYEFQLGLLGVEQFAKTYGYTP